jgi:hypothetical protein
MVNFRFSLFQFSVFVNCGKPRTGNYKLLPATIIKIHPHTSPLYRKEPKFYLLRLSFNVWERLMVFWASKCVIPSVDRPSIAFKLSPAHIPFPSAFPPAVIWNIKTLQCEYYYRRKIYSPKNLCVIGINLHLDTWQKWAPA